MENKTFAHHCHFRGELHSCYFSEPQSLLSMALTSRHTVVQLAPCQGRKSKQAAQQCQNWFAHCISWPHCRLHFFQGIYKAENPQCRSKKNLCYFLLNSTIYQNKRGWISWKIKQPSPAAHPVAWITHGNMHHSAGKGYPVVQLLPQLHCHRTASAFLEDQVPVCTKPCTPANWLATTLNHLQDVTAKSTAFPVGHTTCCFIQLWALPAGKKNQGSDEWEKCRDSKPKVLNAFPSTVPLQHFHSQQGLWWHWNPFGLGWCSTQRVNKLIHLWDYILFH